MHISTRDLKTHLSATLRRVRDGEEISVTSHGRVVARLSPPEKARESAGDALAKLRSHSWLRAGSGRRIHGSEQPTPVADGTSEQVTRWVRGD